ncbi:dephospho-CoA kinase [Jatrophihabitans sp. GAS493]|uniref:dephospho-CoA kinase n=1 Tax=Jatrophihabitans sp. GAS493 TaxID=1907575 RepID=UPI000BB7051F|nr:dephospho-CoA kinase [Jatrophihabitans sp. GAS493]
MMVGLTGGVGAGKSTVAALLESHGAVIIDADAIAREVVRAGTEGFDQVVAEFGPGIVGPDGELDRPKLAALVFGDDAALQRLNGIVHPLVGQRSAEVMSKVSADDIVVYDVPLLVEKNMQEGFQAVVVVEADLQVRLGRLRERGMDSDQAQARMAAQATDEQRRAAATDVIENSGSREELATQASRVWERLVEVRANRR